MGFESLVMEFAEEALVLLNEFEESLLILERQDLPAGDREARLSSLRRTLHTLKGNAGLVGATSIQAAAHVLEDVAAKLQQDPTVRESLLRGCDVVREEVQAILRGRSVEQPAPALLALAEGTFQDEDAVSDQGDLLALGGDLRVRQDSLDELVAVAGDLLVHSGRLQDLVRAPDSDRGLLREAADSLDGSLASLHELVLRIRTIPVGQLFSRFHRMVRDEAQRNGKEATLRVFGGDVAIDKAVLDHLAGALGHVVRNAVVHGIERPEVRRAHGKLSTGEVTLTAMAQGSQIEILVQDDGAGFATEKILQKAAGLGLDQSRGIDNLIFEAGVTTADLSESAGRGVGLEAVQRSINKLGGSVEVESTEGVGALFRLTVPTTIALQRTLLCELNDEIYAFPAANVIEASRLEDGQIRWLGESAALEHRGELVPLVETEEALGLERRGSFVVFLQAGATVAMQVDAFLGKYEFVFQPLDPALCADAPVDSAALMADGRVVLRIDPGRLVHLATREVTA